MSRRARPDRASLAETKAAAVLFPGVAIASGLIAWLDYYYRQDAVGVLVFGGLAALQTVNAVRYWRWVHPRQDARD